MTINTLPRPVRSDAFDRPVQWRTACFLLLSFAVLVSIVAELAINGVGEDGARFLFAQIKSLAAWSNVLLEYVQAFHSTIGDM